MKRAFLFAIIFTFSFNLHGQETPRLNLTFNHLAIHVEDLDRSVDFYKDVLQLTEISKEARTEGVRWFSLGEGRELHLISEQYFKGDDVNTNKAVHLALTTGNFEELTEVFNSNNINYGDWKGSPKKINIRKDGVKQIFFQDPDGYWIEVNSAAQK